MQSHVTKWGNSLGIRIPKSIAQKIGLVEGMPVDLHVKDNAIIIGRKKYDLETLLNEITPQNIHEEVNSGPPVGREIW
ncbi:MAG TPA: AbrB/MazE/SpoVT family DNA-binding domain-containing protein [Bacillota bacterium]|nr:AbrB/MazE/SpoVT family DNA-binding domain-containing protein [Bacillota bacterium]